jgi:transcriptional regulator GlxA family with amidase domain
MHDEEPGTHAGTSHNRARLVNMTKEYLFKNLRQSLGLRMIARQFEVSQEHLARVFKQETGRTVFQHLQHLRLEQAKTLLLSSDRSMAEIATDAGYSSLALFSRSFKRHIGTSPLRYRQQRWGEAIPSQPLNVRAESFAPRAS